MLVIFWDQVLMCVCTAYYVTRSKTYNLWVSVSTEQILTPTACCSVAGMWWLQKTTSTELPVVPKQGLYTSDFFQKG